MLALGAKSAPGNWTVLYCILLTETAPGLGLKQNFLIYGVSHKDYKRLETIALYDGPVS